MVGNAGGDAGRSSIGVTVQIVLHAADPDLVVPGGCEVVFKEWIAAGTAPLVNQRGCVAARYFVAGGIGQDQDRAFHIGMEVCGAGARIVHRRIPLVAGGVVDIEYPMDNPFAPLGAHRDHPGRTCCNAVLVGDGQLIAGHIGDLEGDIGVGTVVDDVAQLLGHLVGRGDACFWHAIREDLTVDGDRPDIP